MIQNSDPGSWIFQKEVSGYPLSKKKCKWSRTAKPAQRHKKIRKMRGKDGKSKNFDRQAAIFYDDSMEATT